MKAISIICLSLLFFSCFSTNRETEEVDQLKERITLLEQRIDSLINSINPNPLRENNLNDNNPAPYRTFWVNSRCQAITKKGTQCGRKAKKNNAYCWQHEK